MKHNKLLMLTLPEIKQIYFKKLPEIVSMARNSGDVIIFKAKLSAYLAEQYGMEDKAVRSIFRLIEFDGRRIYELSRGESITVLTISLLYSFLVGQLETKVETDFLIDLYFQFLRLQDSNPIQLSLDKVNEFSSRWPSGLDEEVQNIRASNKERIIRLLIQKINDKKNRSSHFHFTEGISYDEQYQQVSTWWSDYRFQLAMAVRNTVDLNNLLGNSLSEETLALLTKAREKGMPFFATPYYLSLLNCSGNGGYNDEAIRSYILYSPQLVETFGHIHAWEREDVVQEGKPNAAGWLLPAGHNIHRRYPEVAILIPDTMGRACGGLCASCQRMYNFQSKRLNFDLEALSPKEDWQTKLDRLMDYFVDDSQLRDILITGGDALMSQNKTLRHLLDAVYRMAVRKREANRNRSDKEKYAELQRIRLGSRLPAYLPMRIDDELIAVLQEFKTKAIAIGIRQFIIQTHFQSPLEVTPEAAEGIRKLLSAGWLVDNQLVYNVASSRRGHTTRLRQVLNRLGVVCYYTFSVKGFEENNAVFAPNSRSVQEQCEEKCFGKLSDGDALELLRQLGQTRSVAECIQQFLQSKHLPFLATDRNVLNLPGIGKSMTFVTVGLTAEGKRILRFDHDKTRSHSPIINQLGQVYIVENKSIASYLRQLQSMGEDIEEYATIWNYSEGMTESRFGLFEYPDFPFIITERMTNLCLDS